MSMRVAEGREVSIHYRMTLDDGTELETTFGDEPIDYVHGSSAIVPGLENELVGREPGDELKVSVAPADAFGLVEPDAEMEVPVSDFPGGAEAQVGMPINARGPDGVVQFWVKAVTPSAVVVTSNHPLAGETLNFEVRIVDVRKEAAESAEPPSS